MPWISGEFKVVCDRCSKEIYASKAMKEWNGLIVCSNCFEERHPMDLLRVRKENVTVPFSRPEPPDIHISVTYSGIDKYGDSTGILCAADVGEADLMEVGQYGGMGI